MLIICKKTIEGAIIGGPVLVLIYAFILNTYFNFVINYLVISVLGIVIAILAQVGDLVASGIKRKTGIKDFGNLIPGHGEMNAILNYRGSRKKLEGAKIYVDLFPCNECAKLIIQSGIKEVTYLSDKYANTDSVIASKRLFNTCGITYTQLQKEKQRTLTLSLNE